MGGRNGSLLVMGEERRTGFYLVLVIRVLIGEGVVKIKLAGSLCA